MTILGHQGDEQLAKQRNERLEARKRKEAEKKRNADDAAREIEKLKKLDAGMLKMAETHKKRVEDEIEAKIVAKEV